MKEFVLPELGENIESATVLKILINVGEKIEADQNVIEIETDKATIEVPSTIGGVVNKIFIKEGDKAKIGEVIFSVGEEASEKTTKPVKQAIIANVDVTKIENKNPVQLSQPIESDSVAEFIVPELGESITSATVLKVLVKIGDTIHSDQSVIEIETDKATIEVPSTINGIITEIFIKEGEKVAAGQKIFLVRTSSIQQETKLEIQKPDKKDEKVATENNLVNVKSEIQQKEIPIDNQPPILMNAAPAAPSVRRLARELGVDVNKIPGSSPSGRISLNDVKAFVKKINEEKKSTTVSSEQVGTKILPLPDFTKFGTIERKPMSGIRTKTAEHLSYAWATIPHVTQFDKADITELEKIRRQFAPNVEKQGGKLTMTSILAKVISSALKVFPQFNASVDMTSKEIVYKHYVNIGVAVDTENGLIVPVVRDVDKKNISQISKEINELAEKSRIRKISLDELQGGCFTISNLGGVGGTYFTPIVNSPEAAIIGVSRASIEPVYKENNFVPRLMLPLSLSYDHRIIDGADGIRFLRWVIDALEQPMKILVEG